MPKHVIELAKYVHFLQNEQNEKLLIHIIYYFFQLLYEIYTYSIFIRIWSSFFCLKDSNDVWIEFPLSSGILEGKRVNISLELD